MIRNKGKYLILFFGCIGIFLFCRCDKSFVTDYSKIPVLFVHGSGLTSETWQPMINYLIKKGYPPEYLYAVDLYPRDGSNIHAAVTYIAPAVDTLLSKVANLATRSNFKVPLANKIDVVSHSMGAVSSRWYTAKMRPDQVRTWISIAGANHGSDELCGYTGEAEKEMCPAFAISEEESFVQVGLNGSPDSPLDETPYGIGIDEDHVESIPQDSEHSILYLTIRIEPDRWIKPEKSAILKGAGGIPISITSGLPFEETSSGNYLIKKRSSHDALPQDRQLIKFVSLLLTIRDGSVTVK